MLLVHGSSLVIVENKYGLGAVGGSAGIAKHYEDICSVLNDDSLRSELYASVSAIIDCKQKLGLLQKAVQPPNQKEHEILFLLAEYRPASKQLPNEIAKLKKTIPAKVLFNDKNEYYIDYNRAVDLFTI